jgi:hypothetical protein
MFVRVSHGSIDPARYDDVVALADDFVAAFKRLPGFVAYQTGINRSSGAFVSIATWETADAANFTRDELGDVFERFVALGVSVDPAEVYEQIIRTG